MSEPLVEGAPEVAPEETPEAVEAWGGPSPEEWGQVTNTLGYLAEYVQSQQAPQEERPAVDLYADDYMEQLEAYLDQRDQQRLAPYQQFMESQQTGEAESRALDIIEDLVSREGELVGGEQAHPFILAAADRYYAEEAGKHGAGIKAAEAAITRAFKEQKAYEDAVGQAYSERRMNQLGSLSGAPRDVNAPLAPGTQRVVVTPGGDEMDVVSKFFGRR